MKKCLVVLLAASLSSHLWAGATFSRAHNWVDQEVLTASDLNAEFNNILNNLDPAGMDDYSLTLSQMQTTVDPYPVAVESLATDLKGEIERLRYQILQLKKSIQTTDSTYWYQDTPAQGTFTIKTSSVGVNNTSPSVALDVVGDTKIVGDLNVTGDFVLTPPASVVTVSKTAAQELTFAAGIQVVTFNIALTDRNSDFSLGGDYFVAPSTGYYAVSFDGIWVTTSTTNNSVSFYVYKGATELITAPSFNIAPTGGTAYGVISLSYTGYFAAGDHIYIRAEPVFYTAYLQTYGVDHYENRFNIIRIQ